MTWFEYYIIGAGLVALMLSGWYFEKTKNITVYGRRVEVTTLPKSVQVLVLLGIVVVLWITAPLAVFEVAYTYLKRRKSK